MSIMGKIPPRRCNGAIAMPGIIPQLLLDDALSIKYFKSAGTFSRVGVYS